MPPSMSFLIMKLCSFPLRLHWHIFCCMFLCSKWHSLFFIIQNYQEQSTMFSVKLVKIRANKINAGYVQRQRVMVDLSGSVRPRYIPSLWCALCRSDQICAFRGLCQIRPHVFQTRPERYLNQPVCNFVMISRIVRVVTSRISAVIVVSLNNCAWVRDGSQEV